MRNWWLVAGFGASMIASCAGEANGPSGGTGGALAGGGSGGAGANSAGAGPEAGATGAASGGAAGAAATEAGAPAVVGGASSEGAAPGTEAGATSTEGGAAPQGGSAAESGAGPAGSAGAASGGQRGECAQGGKLRCGGFCVDTATDRANCGLCGRTCAATFDCSGGDCACPVGSSECNGRCVDAQVDSLNCGACGAVCGATEVCKAGKCTCETGERACNQVCAKIASDRNNCGACGTNCSIVQTCTAGKCVASAGGELGPDSCVGLAHGLTLSQIYGYQSVQVPIMRAQAEVAPAARNTDLVAGRDTLFRLFVTVASGFVSRQFSGRVLIDNAGVVDVYYSKKIVSYSSYDSTLDSTFAVIVPKTKINAGTRYLAEIVECNNGAGTVESPRFPASAPVPLGARTIGSLKVKIVRMRVNGVVPDTTDNALAVYKSGAEALYPIAGADISVGPIVDVTNSYDWPGMLDLVRARRQADAPADDVYYYGMLKPAATQADYCAATPGGTATTGCTLGLGYLVPDGTTSAQAPTRAAIGLAFADRSSSDTMLHELGHNHGRLHAPCGQTGTSGVDTKYPGSGGAITVYGWDSRTPTTLISNSWVYDFMGYCVPRWISDYNYDAVLTRLASVNGVLASQAVAPSALQRWRVLLLDSRGPRWGIPVTTPAMASGAPEPARVLDAFGRELEVISVYRSTVGDASSFSIFVPEPQPGWFSVQVASATPLAFAP